MSATIPTEIAAPGANRERDALLALADNSHPDAALEAALRIVLRTCGYNPFAIRRALDRLAELMIPVDEVRHGPKVYPSEQPALDEARAELQKYGTKPPQGAPPDPSARLTPRSGVRGPGRFVLPS